MARATRCLMIDGEVVGAGRAHGTRQGTPHLDWEDTVAEEHADRWIDGLSILLSRRGLGNVAAAALTTLGLSATVDARKKKKKKKKTKTKKPPGPTCLAAQNACDFFNPTCCGEMKCGYNWCRFTDVCHSEEGGPCGGDPCDCKTGLGCDERSGVCSSTCKYPQEQCASDDDCCLNASVCGTNVCVESGRCCQQAGGECFQSCDCCQPNFCNDRTGTCGNCAGLAGTCQNDDDCCVGSAVCGDTATATDVCCQPSGADCAFDQMCCAGLVCNLIQRKCEQAGAPRAPRERQAPEATLPAGQEQRRGWRPGVEPPRGQSGD